MVSGMDIIDSFDWLATLTVGIRTERNRSQAAGTGRGSQLRQYSFLAPDCSQQATLEDGLTTVLTATILLRRMATATWHPHRSPSGKESSR